MPDQPLRGFFSPSDLIRQIRSTSLEAVMERTCAQDFQSWAALTGLPIGEVISAASRFFGCDAGRMRVVGSAQLGFSLISQQAFLAGASDLDLALVDAGLHRRILNEYLPSEPGKVETFLRDGGARGIRPDLIPASKFKSDWLDHFKSLSRAYSCYFSEVSLVIFSSETAFKDHQRAAYETFQLMAAASAKPENSNDLGTICPPPPDHFRRFFGRFRRFQGTVAQSSPGNSSPYSVALHELKIACAGSRSRARLLAQFLHCLDCAPVGITITHALIGGSFLDPDVLRPNDIDCALYYRVDSDSLSSAHSLYAFGQLLRRYCIDARLVPSDAGLDVLVRVTAFVTSLYASRRDGQPSQTGLALVDISR